MPLYQVDAFVTSKQFSGNPAAVCLLPSAADPAWMQDVAMEMNLSETAFLLKRPDGFDLRWFTPTVEVDLCGHATLASAHTLWESGQLPPTDQARFYTRSGLLTADRCGELIELNFPAKLAQQAEPPPELIAALGVTPAYVGKNQFDYLIEVDQERTVREMKPDFTRLRKVGVRGVIVTSRSTEFDFVSRFFAPGSGIDEDPVTGSAHTALGPYWMAKLHKDVFRAYQASRRGGLLVVSVKGDRVLLAGTARTTLRGELV
jgi:PhzF family phenazine biosynthesis protein